MEPAPLLDRKYAGDGLAMRWAYPVLLGIMAVVGGGMLMLFWKIGWIGGGSEGEEVVSLSEPPPSSSGD